MAKIHPTAVVDTAAVLADDVEIGPWCVVERDVTLGSGCVLRPNAVVRQYTTMGRNNLVDSFTVIGSQPQDLKFVRGDVSYIRIGDNNVFREGCTVSRATPVGCATVVGNNTYWMTGVHVGHDSVVEDDVVLGTRATVAGHVTIRRGAAMSSHAGVHQFCWVGEKVLVQANSAVTAHIPPFVMFAGVNDVVGLHHASLRRDGVTSEQRKQLKEAFDLLFLSRLPVFRVLEEMNKCTDWTGPAVQFRDFVRDVSLAEKPFNRPMARLRKGAVAEAEE